MKFLNAFTNRFATAALDDATRAKRIQILETQRNAFAIATLITSIAGIVVSFTPKETAMVWFTPAVLIVFTLYAENSLRLLKIVEALKRRMDSVSPC